MLSFIPIALVMLYSIGQTAFFYFFSDDYSMLYHIQRNKFPGPPYNQAYQYLYKPLYQIFELHPFPYFALGVITYFIATVSIFWLVKTVTNRSKPAYFSALIFATGYIGINQFGMMMVSSVNNLTIAGMSIALGTYFLWLKYRHFRYYILALGISLLLLKLFPYRAYSLVLFLPTMALLYGVKGTTWHGISKSILLSLLSVVPIYVVGRLVGIFSYGGNQMFATDRLLTYMKPELVEQFFAVFGRIILPQHIANAFFIAVNQHQHAMIGMLMTGVCMALGFVLWLNKKTSSLGKHLLFVLALTIEGYAGYFFFIPFFDSDGAINRYLPIAFMGFSMLFPMAFTAIGKLFRMERRAFFHIISTLSLVSYVSVLAFFSHQYTSMFLRNAGQPAVRFVSQVRSAIPRMPEHLTIYVDSTDYHPGNSHLGHILHPAMFTNDATFGVWYNVPKERITYPTSLHEYVDLLKQSADPEGTFYSFYYDGVNLRNTTDDLLYNLRSNEYYRVTGTLRPVEITEKKQHIELNVDGISSLAQQQLAITVALAPLDGNQFTYPYFFGNPTQTEKRITQEYFDSKKITKKDVFDYLTARNVYYQHVTASASASHHQYPPEFLVDKRFDTWWLYAENFWQIHKKPSLVIDVGSEKMISRVLWVPMKDRRISVYGVSVSSDGDSWKTIDIQSSTSENGDMLVVMDSFAPVIARFVKYDIKETENGQTPGIKELEVLEDSQVTVDFFASWRIADAPFEYIGSQEELAQAYMYVREHGTIGISTKTDKDPLLSNQYDVTLPVKIDGKDHTYFVPIAIRGRQLKKIGIHVPYPVMAEVKEVKIVRSKVIVN